MVQAYVYLTDTAKSFLTFVKTFEMNYAIKCFNAKNQKTSNDLLVCSYFNEAGMPKVSSSFLYVAVSDGQAACAHTP